MRKKTAFLCLLLILPLFLTGCWDYKDYNSLALVSALGIDVDETSNEITVTLVYYIPGGGGGSTEKKSGSQNLPTCGAVKAKGSTITDALATIQEARRKQLFYGYMDVVVVGETAAKSILKQLVQLCDRTPNFRMTAYMAITQGTAEEVLTTLDPNTSVTIGRNIYDLIRSSSHAGSAFPVSFEDFAEKLVISGVEPAAPQVTVRVTGAKTGTSSENSERKSRSNIAN